MPAAPRPWPSGRVVLASPYDTLCPRPRRISELYHCRVRSGRRQRGGIARLCRAAPGRQYGARDRGNGGADAARGQTLPRPLWVYAGRVTLSPAHLFENNAAWAARMAERDPEFFSRLQQQQAPDYLWIGCSDSRVPANEIVGLPPGELFVHRNVANVVVHTDLNCLSVLQYAVDVLGVEHVIVVRPLRLRRRARRATKGATLGLIDNWLRHVAGRARRDTRRSRRRDRRTRAVDRLCELNVIEQARHVCETTVVRDAWKRGPAAGRPRLDLQPARRPPPRSRLRRVRRG